MINIKFDNISAINPNQFDSYDHSTIHYYVIYSVMSVNMLILMIAIVVICIKQIYFVNNNVDLRNQTQIQDIQNVTEQNVVEDIQMSIYNETNEY